jgi:hypothetical protein
MGKNSSHLATLAMIPMKRRSQLPAVAASPLAETMVKKRPMKMTGTLGLRARVM